MEKKTLLNREIKNNQRLVFYLITRAKQRGGLPQLKSLLVRYYKKIKFICDMNTVQSYLKN